MRLNAILKAFEIGLQLRGSIRRQRIDHPILMPLRIQNSLRLQIAQVLGDLDLSRIEQPLKMADAQRPLREKIHDAKPGLIAKAFVDPDKSRG